MLPLSYNMFSSFGPVYDSTFANVTVEESRLVMSSDQPATKRRFLDRADHKDLIRSVCVSANDYYTSTFVDHMLAIFDGKEVKDEDFLTKPVMDTEKMDDDSKDWSATSADVVVDFESIKSLAEDGIDMSFVDSLQPRYESRLIEGETTTTDSLSTAAKVGQRLQHTAGLLTNLRHQQLSRLSAPPPLSLQHVPGPSELEARLAEKVVENLATIISSGSATPQQVTSVEAIRYFFTLKK